MRVNLTKPLNKIRCYNCGGLGLIPGSFRRCEKCKGTGIEPNPEKLDYLRKKTIE